MGDQIAALRHTVDHQIGSDKHVPVDVQTFGGSGGVDPHVSAVLYYHRRDPVVQERGDVGFAQLMNLQGWAGAVVGDREALGHLYVRVYGVNLAHNAQIPVDIQIGDRDVMRVDVFQVVTETRQRHVPLIRFQPRRDVVVESGQQHVRLGLRVLQPSEHLVLQLNNRSVHGAPRFGAIHEIGHLRQDLRDVAIVEINVRTPRTHPQISGDVYRASENALGELQRFTHLQIVRGSVSLQNTEQIDVIVLRILIGHRGIVRVGINHIRIVPLVHDVVPDDQRVVAVVHQLASDHHRVHTVVAVETTDRYQVLGVGGSRIVTDRNVVVPVVASKVSQNEVPSLTFNGSPLHALVPDVDVLSTQRVVLSGVATQHGVVGGAHGRP